MSKVLIIIESGMVSEIHSNNPATEVIIVDIDKNAGYENDVSISDPQKPDIVRNKIYKSYEDYSDDTEEDIYNKLKELNF